MRSLIATTAWVPLLLGVLPRLVEGQFVSSLPDCVQNCIKNSGDINCADLDISCICRASNGNFLADVVNCMRSNCDNDLDRNILLLPLQTVCDLAGQPISSQAIANAENEPSSGASVTKTVTETQMTGAGGSTVRVSTMTYTTRTTVGTTTDSTGSTYFLVAPVTVWSLTTPLAGAGSTLTTSALTSTATTSKTSTTGSTPRTESTTGTTTSTSTSTDSGTTTFTSTTKVAAESKGSGVLSAATGPVVTETSGGGSPFDKAGAATRVEGGNWLLLVVGFMAGILAF